MRNFCIPTALQIDLDDIGWFNGADDRQNGGPSRTGVGRRHCAKDYLALDELGRRLGMRINCGFVAGEWDPDNRLRPIPHLSKYGDKWDNAAYFDAAEAARCADVLNCSSHIDLALHALSHGYYKSSVDSHDISDFYYRENKVYHMVPRQEVRARLDAFFDLLQHHGIQKKIHSFIPPSAAYRLEELSHVLKEYGIRYVGTIYARLKPQPHVTPKKEITVESSGVITYERTHNPIPWDRFGADWEDLPPLSGLVGLHWPNILHEDPERNIECVERAATYFLRCADRFGTVMSQDVSCYVTQTLYRRFARVRTLFGCVRIDLSRLPRMQGAGEGFFVSSKKEITSCLGAATITERERKAGFINYYVVPKAKIVKLRFK